RRDLEGGAAAPIHPSQHPTPVKSRAGKTAQKRKRPGVSRSSPPSLTPQRRVNPMRGFDDCTVPSSQNAFSASFLHRFNRQDEPTTAGEADVAGPWHVEEIPGQG